MAPTLPALAQSASATALPKTGSGEGELARAASHTDLRTQSKKPKSGLVEVKFKGDHGITFEGNRVSHSVLQAWMLGVRPGWTVLSIEGQAVRTKEEIEENLQAAVDREKRYIVHFEKGQGKFGTEAKEKAEREKRQLAKLRKEFRFQGRIEKAEHRGTTVSQIERVCASLEENCAAWTDHLPAKMSKTSGQPLRIDFLNFYHLSNYLILPVTKPRQCSFVEMMASQPQQPSWFLSHWWGTPVVSLAEGVLKHVATRVHESSYWIWAFAARLHDKHSEIPEEPTEAPFYKPMEVCKFKVLMILDPQAVYFKRTWCLFELALSLDSTYAVLDIAHAGSNSAELVTHGLTEEEEKRDATAPGQGVRAKLLREGNFPVETAETGLWLQAEKSEAVSEEEKALLLHSLGSFGQTEAKEKLDIVDKRLRARLATALWPRVGRADKDSRAAPTKRARQAFHVLSADSRRRSMVLNLFGLSSEYMRMLAENLPPNLVELTLHLRCSSFQDEDLAILAKALPKHLKELKLDMTCCHNVTDAGIKQLEEQLDFDETAAYIRLAETSVSKEVQEWYELEAAKNEANGQSGQLKNVSRALHMNLCLSPDTAEPLRRTLVPAASLLGKVITEDEDSRAVAALRALNSFGEKARSALGTDAQQRAKEIEEALEKAEEERKAKEAQRAAKKAAAAAPKAAAAQPPAGDAPED